MQLKFAVFLQGCIFKISLLFAIKGDIYHDNVLDNI